MVAPYKRAKKLSPYGFLSDMQELSSDEKQIFAYVVSNGRCTVEQLERHLDLDSVQIKASLGKLMEAELLFCQRSSGYAFYSVALSKRSQIEPEQFPSGPIIPLIYQFNLLSDVQRTSAFVKCIKELVRPGDIVVDLGCGNSVLSMAAAQNASYVFAVEIDPSVADAAEYFIKSAGLQDKIKLVRTDAREVVFPDRVDVVVCEMLDTALIAELQVAVTNHAVESILKEGGTIIPYGARTFAELVNVDYSAEGWLFPLPHYEAYGARAAAYSLTPQVAIHEIAFGKINELIVEKDVRFRPVRHGILNSLRLTTVVQLTPQEELLHSDWLNPPLVLPIEPLQVEKDERLLLKLKYELGGGLEGLTYDVIRGEY